MPKDRQPTPSTRRPHPKAGNDLASRLLAPDGVVFVDARWRVVQADDTADRMSGGRLARSQSLWTLCPDLIEATGYDELHRTMEEHVACQFVSHLQTQDRWLAVEAQPHAAGLRLRVRDVTGAMRAEQQLRRLNEEHDAIHRIASAVASGLTLLQIIHALSEGAARVTGAAACGVIRFDGSGATLMGIWSAAEFPHVAGAVFPLEGFGAMGGLRSRGASARFHDVAPHEVLATWGHHDVSAVPLLVGRRRWGALFALDTAADEMPDDAVQRLGRMARVGGLSVADALQRERLEREANTDPLTGLTNRRSYERRLSAMTAGAGGVLLAGDIDGLKAINDTRGHHGGDQVLRRLGDVLRHVVRDDDVAARTGGDEVAVLLMGADPAQGSQAADRILRQLRAGSPSLSLSVGVCEPSRHDDIESSMTCADRAAYRSKQAGGGRCSSGACLR